MTCNKATLGIKSMANKNTKKPTDRKNVQMRVTVSNDHFEALEGLASSTGIKLPTLASIVFKAGVPLVQKRFAVDSETN